MSDEAGTSPQRIAGLIIMIGASVWIGVSAFFSIGLATAWIEETGLTAALQPRVWSVLFGGATSAAVGYGVLRFGRWLRGVT